MRGYAPQMSERISNEAVPVSVELILHRLKDFRPLVHCALHDAVNVGEVYIQAHRAPTNSGRAGVSLSHAGILVGQHDMRVTDLQFGMSDLAVRAVHASDFRRTENLLVVFNGLGGAVDN